MFSEYRRVLGRPGALLFSVTGLVARLPISMIGLGIVLLVSTATGSYAVAGSVSAVWLVANAGCAILQGRLLDRFGQARVLVPLISVFAVALGALVWAVETDRPRAVWYACAVAGGIVFPSVGSCVRARWSHALRGDPRGLASAFALEAVADEAVFMTGPILVTLLATSWHPAAGLAAALVLGTTFTVLFAAQRATQPPAHPPAVDRAERPRMPWATVLPLAVVSLALGTLFGNAEVTTVAFSQSLGHRGYAGFLLATWALGSLFAGLVTGMVQWRRGPATRVRWGTVAMMMVMLPLAAIGSAGVMAAALLVAGFAIAPTLIGTMTLTEQTVPSARLVEGMSILQTGIVAGVAPGAALGGVVIDAHGASAAYLVSAAAGAVAAVAAQFLPRGR
ncbi:MAG: MFS transporter [Nocardioides sp.]